MKYGAPPHNYNYGHPVFPSSVQGYLFQSILLFLFVCFVLVLSSWLQINVCTMFLTKLKVFTYTDCVVQFAWPSYSSLVALVSPKNIDTLLYNVMVSLGSHQASLGQCGDQRIPSDRPSAKAQTGKVTDCKKKTYNLRIEAHHSLSAAAIN